MEKENTTQIDNALFEIVCYGNREKRLYLNHHIINYIDNVEYITNYIAIILYYIKMNRHNDNAIFLKLKTDNNNIRAYTKSFFAQLGIEIKDIEEDVLFIPINMLFDNVEDTNKNIFSNSMKYIHEELKREAYSDFLARLIRLYNIIPVKKNMLMNEPDYLEANSFFNFRDNFIQNEILRKYSLEDDIKIYNKKGKKIISIEDDKSPLFILLNKNNYDMEISKEKNAYFINPNMAKIFKKNVLSIELMLNMLGYDLKEIGELLKKVSNKKLSIMMVGLGGTMSNFVYFATELAKLARLKNNIFKNVVVYENDKLEVSNLPRIPIDYISPIFLQNNYFLNKLSNNKVNMLFNVDKLGDNVITQTKQLYKREDFGKNFNWVIGTPNIQTRTLISEVTNKFICPMHSNNELYIFIAPKVIGSDLMFETYGRIRLSKFFFNMLEMTIQCLKLMLNDNYDDKVGEMVYQYSIDNVDIEKNMVNFKREESVMI